MKSRMLSLLVAGLVCALMFVGWTVYAEKPKKPNKAWEYKVVRLCATENDLNMFGKDGWELTSVEPSGRFVCPAYYFKRVR
jgi:hypothetical protein